MAFNLDWTQQRTYDAVIMASPFPTRALLAVPIPLPTSILVQVTTDPPSYIPQRALV